MCYDNFITIRAICGGVDSKSNLYVEDIPGLSVVTIASAAGPEAQSANEVVADACRLAFERFKSDITANLAISYSEKAIDTVGNFKFGDNVESPEVGSGGMRVKFTRTAYSRLRINRFYFKSAAAVTNKVITITDGVKIETHTISAAADEELIVETNFFSHQGPIEISYDASDAVPYTKSIAGHSSLACESCTNQNHSTSRIACYGFYPGQTNTSVLYGLHVDATLECDGEKAMCSILPTAKMQMLYLVGHILFEKRISSNRLNWITISGKEYAQEKSAEYEDKYLQLLKNTERSIMSYLQRVDPVCTSCRTLQYSYSF